MAVFNTPMVQLVSVGLVLLCGKGIGTRGQELTLLCACSGMLRRSRHLWGQILPPGDAPTLPPPPLPSIKAPWPGARRPWVHGAMAGPCWLGVVALGCHQRGKSQRCPSGQAGSRGLEAAPGTSLGWDNRREKPPRFPVTTKVCVCGETPLPRAPNPL